jgi:hypothetical protein
MRRWVERRREEIMDSERRSIRDTTPGFSRAKSSCSPPCGGKGYELGVGIDAASAS